MPTIAEQVATLFDDGQSFETDEGLTLDEVCCDKFDGIRQYGVRKHRDDASQSQDWVAGSTTEHFAGDPIRYEFTDGSAIVEHGEGWDIEGKKPFSWKG